MLMLLLVAPSLAAPLAQVEDVRSVPAGTPEDAPAPIINGEDASEDDYPQAGGIIIDMYLDMGSWGSGELRTFVCSSTLIAPDVVMMAAHCIDEMAFTYGYGDMEINEIRWTRQADLSDWDGTQRNPGWPDDSIVASDWIANSRFDLTNMGLGVAENHDIALVFLEEPVLDTPFAYIATEEETDQLVEGELVTIVGWGQQVATDTWESPPEGSYALKQMGEAPVGDIGEAEFQVGPDEDDPRKCHGDSGGPTFKRIETDSTETLRVIGVTSHAYDGTDCNETGGVDTRVMRYREWIEEQMVSRCEDGTRSWCEEPGLPVPPLPVEDEDTGGDDEEEDEAKACGCATADPTLAAWVFGLAVVARRRSRRG
jgi:hypothetical protein